MPRPEVSNRDSLVNNQVEKLYLASKMPAALWMWQTHVQYVAEEARKIAKEVKANIEKTVSGAFLHDVADVRLLRTDTNYEKESQEIATNVLKHANFTDEEIEEIIVQILGPHSCYPENMPKTLDAKVLATADALGHLVTNFYTDMTIERLQQFGIEMTEEERHQWMHKKIERDFNSKIFFDKAREEVRSKYELLLNKER